MNLTNREKQLVTLAYYQGSCDNCKVSAKRESFTMLDNAARLAAQQLLEELGLEYPDTQDIDAFFNVINWNEVAKRYAAAK